MLSLTITLWRMMDAYEYYIYIYICDGYQVRPVRILHTKGGAHLMVHPNGPHPPWISHGAHHYISQMYYTPLDRLHNHSNGQYTTELVASEWRW